MTLTDHDLSALVEKYISSNQVVSLGTGTNAVSLLKKLALRIEMDHLTNIQFIPTSHEMAAVASQMSIKMGNVDELDIDVAIEFVNSADRYFNFIKNDSTSLVRDKMIAQNARELTIICDQKNVVERLGGSIAFEISQFGYQKTIQQLKAFGESRLRMKGKESLKTESGHLLVDVQVDAIFDLDELETATRRIPGVIESALFVGYADRLVVHNGHLEAKSRMSPPEELKI